MARAFAKAFYNSAAWIKTSKAYAESRFWICERCHRPIKGQYIVHHNKIHLSPENIHDPDIALNWRNLMLLCNDCHNAVHQRKKLRRKVLFSPGGQVIGVKDPPSGP